MLQQTTAQKYAAAWATHEGSALHQFGVDGIWKFEYHRVYLNEIQELINLPETALHPFIRPRAKCVQLEQLKHFFEQKGNEHGIETVWHNNFYGFPVPFTAKEYPTMKPIHKLI